MPFFLNENIDEIRIDKNKKDKEYRRKQDKKIYN